MLPNPMSPKRTVFMAGSLVGSCHLPSRKCYARLLAVLDWTPPPNPSDNLNYLVKCAQGKRSSSRTSQ